MSIKALDDATTCEQYVVAKLKSDEATIKRMIKKSHGAQLRD